MFWMGYGKEVEEVESLERGLLSEVGSYEESDGENETILYEASFQQMEDNFVKYNTAQWILYSLLLILAWGFGFLMILYLPVRRYILQKDIRSRKLYLTPNAIVYKVTKPVPFPCFGVLKREKHILLASVADIIVEQGYLQSFFGVYSLRIENTGVRRPPSDDVHILGIANPNAFRKAVLMRRSSMKNEAYSRQISTTEDIPSLRGTPSKTLSLRHDRDLHLGEQVLLQRVEEIGSSVKRIQSLIKEQQPQAPGPTY